MPATKHGAKRKKAQSGQNAKKRRTVVIESDSDDESSPSPALAPAASPSAFSNASLQNYRRWLALQEQGQVEKVLQTMERSASAPPRGLGAVDPESSESEDSDDFGCTRKSSARKRKPMWDETGNTICSCMSVLIL